MTKRLIPVWLTILVCFVAGVLAAVVWELTDPRTAVACTYGAAIGAMAAIANAKAERQARYSVLANMVGNAARDDRK